MTKRQYMQKIRHCLRQQNKTILRRAEALWVSGAFDPKEYEDDFLLPRIVVTALDKEAAWGWEPLHEADKATVKNLSHF